MRDDVPDYPYGPKQQTQGTIELFLKNELEL